MTDDADRLIERIRNHEQEALAEFIQLRTPQIIAFIERRMSDSLRKKVEPTDILQDLSISCLNALDQVDFEGRDPFRWLCQQAERRIIDEHRKQFGAQKRAAHREVGIYANDPNKGSSSIENLLVASLTTPSKKFSKAQKEFHLVAAMDELGDEAQTALRMRYLEGLPSKEIAAKIGKSDAATRVLLSRSLKKLQDLLAANEDFQTMIARQSNSND